MFNQENINELMQEHLKSDEIQKYVDDKVKATLKDAIDNQFSSFSRGNGDDNNQGYLKIHEIVQSAIGLNLDEIKIPEFQAMYIDTINGALNKIANEDMSLMMQKNMDKLLITDKKEITLQELIYEYMDDERILDRYAELINEWDECHLREVTADEIDIGSILENSELMGLLLQKDENKRYLEVCFQESGNEDHTFQYDNGFRIKKVDDKADDDLYEVWSYHNKNIGDEKTNILRTNFTSFERLCFQITKGITKLKITKSELNDYFEEKR